MSRSNSSALAPAPIYNIATQRDFSGVLPDRYRVKDHLVIDEHLTIYEVFDRFKNRSARVWLETSDSTSPAWYWSQARHLQALEHTNLLPVYDHWLDLKQRKCGMVVKSPGPNFFTLNRLTPKALPLMVVNRIIRQVGQALAYCHSLGLLHLHLQPEFIWLGLDGKVYLEPFTARTQRTPSLQFSPGETEKASLYNSSFCSPEVFKPQTLLDKRADVYSLAYLAYILLSSVSPFPAISTPLKECGADSFRPSEPLPLSMFIPCVSPRLEAALSTGLKKERAERYITVEEFLRDFEAGMADTVLGMAQVPSVPSIASLLEQDAQITLAKRASISAPPHNLPALLFDKKEKIIECLSLALSFIKRKPRGLGIFSGLGMLIVFLVIGVGLLNQTDRAHITLPATLTSSLKPTSAQATPVSTEIPAPISTVTAAVADQAGLNNTVEASDPYEQLLVDADKQLFEKNEFEEALKTYAQIIARNPEYASAYRQLGEAYYLRGYTNGSDNAVEVLKKAVTLQPGDVLAWTYLALAYYDAYQYDKGWSAVSQALRLKPQLATAQAVQAVLLVETEDMGRANQVIEEALGLDPDNFWVNWSQHLIAKHNKDWEQALKSLDKLLNHYPRLAMLHTAKGEVLHARGTVYANEALLWFRQALQLDRHYPYAYSGLAAIYYEQGKLSEAQVAFTQALTLQPGHARSLSGRGYVSLKQGKYEEAISFFNKAVQADAREAEGYNGLASAYLSKGEWGQVISWSELAIRFAPSYADAYYNKGRALYELKDFRGSVEAFIQATRLSHGTVAHYQEGLKFADAALSKELKP